MKIIDKPLIKDYTTYKLSGKIDKIIIPENIEELKKEINGEYKILGSGSNLIISETYKGKLIKLDNFDKLEIEGNIVKVGAGYLLPKLAHLLANKNLSGLEFACSIPGTIGGAIYMNAGAHGREMKDIVKTITILDENKKIKTLSREDIEFKYRDSILKHKKYICLEVELILENKDKDDIIKTMKKYIGERRKKQPTEPSAGSVFKNGDYSSGKLIDEAGLKGYKIKGAKVSEKHANFIINTGSASAEDIIKLIDTIKEKIKEKYNIELECEQEILKGWKVWRRKKREK